jgi:hypothetical protein
MALEEAYTAAGGVWDNDVRCQEWRDEHGRLHQVAGPAVIWPDGHREWWLHGQLHRVDGPAVIYPNGTRVWYLHGQQHRADGPAIIYANGRQSWYVQDREITAEVEDWMGANAVTWPFNESQQMEFALRWL